MTYILFIVTSSWAMLVLLAGFCFMTKLVIKHKKEDVKNM